MTTRKCSICNSESLRRAFISEHLGATYVSYFCGACGTYQTLDHQAALSPDYIDLRPEQIDAAHQWLQRAHKRTAFEQWKRVVELGDGDARGKRLLDVGCGVGGFLDFAEQLGLETYGFDLSKAQVEIARLKHKRVHNAQSVDDYIRQLTTPITFNYVTLWDVFEHIREPISLLESVRSVLDRNGKLFLSVPGAGPNGLKIRLAKLRGVDPGLIPWEHVFYYSTHSLRLVMEKSGFRVVRSGGVLPYLRPLSLLEGVRRFAHHALRPTSLALQIYVVGSPA